MTARAKRSAGQEDGRNGIQVIARAAAVLRALKTSSGMSLGQIAERVDLPRSTVQRIVGALQAERMVIGSRSGMGIRLGPELHALAEAARFDMVELMRPMLQQLAADTEETVDLSMRRDGRMVFIDQVPGSHRLRAVSAVGEAFPLTVTANGRACLAIASDMEIAKLVAAEPAGLSLDEVTRIVAEVRRNGLAFDRDEHTPGISAIGIGFLDPRDDSYAISVPVPTSRFAEREGAIAAALKSLSREIADLFGR